MCCCVPQHIIGVYTIRLITNYSEVLCLGRFVVESVCVAWYFRAVKVTIRILRSARMLCCYSFYRCMWLIGDKDGGSVHRVHAFLFILIILQKDLCGKF